MSRSSRDPKRLFRAETSPRLSEGMTMSETTDLYLDLLKKCLTRYAFPDHYRPVTGIEGLAKTRMLRVMQSALARKNLALARYVPFDPRARAEGLDRPPEAETMVGLRRLDNLQDCISQVLQDDVPGDLIETGTWRGGAAVFMRAVLKAHDDSERIVWVADSFEGLPKPSPDRYPADVNDLHWTQSTLVATLEDVKANFERYGLLDDQVRFLVGWFKDTLSRAPINQLAVLRLDGDMYESTMQGLEALYHKVSLGGFAIIDDYYTNEGCRLAVDDFCEKDDIAPKLIQIDRSSVFWRKM